LIFDKKIPSESYGNRIGSASLPDAAYTFTTPHNEDTDMNMQPILLNLIAKLPPRKPHIRRRVAIPTEDAQRLPPAQPVPASG
jgi:hypothetical protein